MVGWQAAGLDLTEYLLELYIFLGDDKVTSGSGLSIKEDATVTWGRCRHWH